MNDEEKQRQAEEYLEQGNAYSNQGNYASAIVSYNEAIKLEPDDAAIYYNLGIASSNQGDYAEAIVSYNKAIELNPDYADAYNNLGIAYRNQGDYARAMVSYNRAIELNPDYVAAYYNLGNAYRDQGDYASAIVSYNKAIELNPDYVDAYNNLGIAYRNQGDYASAMVSYNRAIELNPDDADVHYNLGIAYSNQGDYASAIVSYNRAIELNPDFATAYYNLIKLCQNRKDEYVDKVTAILNDNKKYFKIDIVYMMSIYTDIDELIRKLLDNGYDDYFSRMLNKYNKSNEKSEEYGIYEKIYLSSNKIMQLLHVNNNEETTRGFAHYTRKITAENLLIKEKESKDISVSPFRLSSILTSNDPTEGTIAFTYLGLENEEKDRDYQAFIGCFTFDPESLNQFRLYGKDQGKEATGVSLVFKKDFFAEKPAGMASYSMAGEKDDSGTKQDAKQGAKKEYALYRCIYIDPETKQIMTLGYKDDYTFFRDRLDEPGENELSDEEKSEVDGKIKIYHDKINENLQKVQKEFDALKQLIRDNKDKIEEKLICDLLINLRYLVKHIAFKEEQECRVVKVESLRSYDKQGNRKVILDGDNMFINTRAIDRLVERVYFAPSTPDMELFQEKLVYTGLKVECRKCTHPIRITKT
jgi:tetratricopeptide (TPR) repeat protein